MIKYTFAFIAMLIGNISYAGGKSSPISYNVALAELATTFGDLAGFRNVGSYKNTQCSLEVASLESTVGGIEISIQNSNGKRVSFILSSPSNKVYKSTRGNGASSTLRWEVVKSSSTIDQATVELTTYEDISDFTVTIVSESPRMGLQATTCFFQE